MRIKSYFAGSVEQAIHEARHELGGEAVLITSRRAAPEARHLGAYEVVFGTSPGTDLPAAAETPDLNREVAVLRDQVENIKRSMQSNGAASPTYAQPEMERLYQELVAAGLDAVVAQRTLDEASNAWRALPVEQKSSGTVDLEELVIESIRKKLQFAPESTAAGADSKRILILVGPPGAGKTTTLAKIAIREYLSRRLSMRIISFDPFRVAAHEKLRALARIIGVGFTVASSMQEFIEAIDEFRNKDILLIDTPGFSRNDTEGARDLADFLSAMSSKEIHLALSVSMQREDLKRCLRQYEMFQPDYLLFTKLDETECRGASLGVALEAGKPISFLTAGQSIPEDIQRASSEALLSTLFTSRPRAATSAA
jgi:flagellar biosynthesis protein FlhF